MNFQKYTLRKISVLWLIIFTFSAVLFAQNTPERNNSVARNNNLYCAGFIQSAPVNTGYKVVGAEEADQNIFAQGDNLVVNFGANRGAKVGDMYSVIRPRGKVQSRWTDKKNLGFYVQEVGAVEIVEVKDKFSIAQIRTSCDNMVLGDLLTPVPSRESLTSQQRPMLDAFAESSGKVSGRVVMARDGQEIVAANQIVFVDLGSEDNVQVGNYLTVYRSQGIRRVVGELVILNVREKTATAMVVQTMREVHTGDYVELQ